MSWNKLDKEKQDKVLARGAKDIKYIQMQSKIRIYLNFKNI